eukprot:TRINITY_DN68878_c0_g1_i1.p1 TRINITY_DN68878_c0_g1~~TRINITY_DN68878_c0_g1_i1.p1  ORF type:complete len:1008 (-),score=202.50 TRINITY_DN68878_c0_g1_i1:123-2933(-)
MAAATAAPVFLRRARPGQGKQQRVASLQRRRSSSSGSEGGKCGRFAAPRRSSCNAKNAAPVPIDTSPNDITTSNGVDNSGGGQGSSATHRSSGVRRGRLSLEQSDEDEQAPAFQVKKSKLSKQMKSNSVSGRVEMDNRRHAASSRRSGTAAADVDEVVIVDDAAPKIVRPQAVPVGMPRPGSEEDDDVSMVDAQAMAAARLARAKRAAARELQGGSVTSVNGTSGVASGEASIRSTPQAEEFIPLVRSRPVSFAAAVDEMGGSSGDIGTERSSPFEVAPHIAGGHLLASASSLSGSAEEVDAADAWALQQMRIGAHRRRAGFALPMELLDTARENGEAGTAASTASALLPSHRERSDPAVAAAAAAAARPRGSSGGMSAGDVAASAATTTATMGQQRQLQAPSPAESMAQLWEALRRIEGGVTDRARRSEELEEQRLGAVAQLRESERQEKILDKCLRAVQELDELAWGLAGLLDAKVGKLRQASQTLKQMENDVVAKRWRRRARCLTDDLVSNGGASISKPTVSEIGDAEGMTEPPIARIRDRRAARRASRRCGREAAPLEGWDTSSASEIDEVDEWAADRSAFCSAAHKQIFGDVAEPFSNVLTLLKPLEKSKRRLANDYEKAFVPVSLPEMLSMYVEYSLLWWDPLRLCPRSPQHGRDLFKLWGPREPITGTQFEEFEWFGELASFSELRGEDDPDGSLVPTLVRRFVFPEVARRLRDCWDVTSASQSLRIAALFDECLLFEEDVQPDQGLSDGVAVDGSAVDNISGDRKFSDLVKWALRRLEKGLEEHAPEVFVPLEALPRWYASAARWRLLWRSCKIAHCAMILDERLPDEHLQRLVLGAIFGTRVAPHLRSPRTDVGEMALLERFVALLPRRWLDGGLPPALAPLRDALGPRAPVGTAVVATAASAARIMQTLRCFDEAQVILQAMKGSC